MDPRASAPPRVAVCFPGDPLDPTARSGTPFGVVSGLRALGVEAVPVRAVLARGLERSIAVGIGATYLHRASGDSPLVRLKRGYSAAVIGTTLARLRSRAGQRALDRAGPLDAIVQLGTGYRVRSRAPLLVYDDMTIPQALAYAYDNWTTLRPSQRERRIALQRQIYREARACCMTTTWAAASVTSDHGIPPEQIVVVGAGSHEDVRHPERSWSVPRFLFVGKDWERKNGPRVLRAFAAVREQVPGASLDLVGGHPDVRQDGVRTHGLLRRDRAPERDALRALFDQATCFVMPSLFEPGGVVFTEAAAAGLPSIGGRIGGSRDLIGPGGLVVDPTSDADVTEAMLRLTDPAHARHLGALASEHAATLTWPQVARRLLAAAGLEPPMQRHADHLTDRLTGA